MVRSILLRGFDQDMANKIGEFMEKVGVNFIKEASPTKFEKSKDGKILATYFDGMTGMEKTLEYDTVLLAIGRYAVTGGLNLEKIGVKLAKSGKVIVNESEQSTISNIYSIGDCAEGRPELTPPAIMVI